MIFIHIKPPIYPIGVFLTVYIIYPYRVFVKGFFRIISKKLSMRIIHGEPMIFIVPKLLGFFL